MRYLARGFLLLGLIAALTLLLAKGEPATVALAKGVGSSVSPIGLGFNYTNSTGIMVVYAGAGTPSPAPSVTFNTMTYYAAAMLPTGITGSWSPTTGVVADPGSNGSLYVYVASTTPCAQCAFGPVSLKFTLAGLEPAVMVVYAPSGSIPNEPTTYSTSALWLGSGVTAGYDGTNLTERQGSTGSLYLFLHCPSDNNPC